MPLRGAFSLWQEFLAIALDLARSPVPVVFVLPQDGRDLVAKNIAMTDQQAVLDQYFPTGRVRDKIGQL